MVNQSLHRPTVYRRGAGPEGAGRVSWRHASRTQRLDVLAQLRGGGAASQSERARPVERLPLRQLHGGVWAAPEVASPTLPHVAVEEIRPHARPAPVLRRRPTPRPISTMEDAQHRRMDPTAERLNDLGEPDVGNPPVRLDEGRYQPSSPRRPPVAGFGGIRAKVPLRCGISGLAPR